MQERVRPDREHVGEDGRTRARATAAARVRPAARPASPPGGLVVGAADDRLEQEADQVAADVIGMVNRSGGLMRSSTTADGTRIRRAARPDAPPRGDEPAPDPSPAPPPATRIRRSTAPCVQRLLGFEAELSVPTYGPAPGSLDPGFTSGPADQHGKAPKATIQQFLLGGLPYGVNRGSNDHFTLKPDHNELQGIGLAIFTRLRALGYAPEPRNPTISNLEYVTPPRDELAPGADAAYKADAAAIKAHVDRTIGTIGGKTAIVGVPPPAAQTFTGIPVADMRDWLGGAYEDAELKRLVTEYQAAIKNELYLQATAGILPSALRDIHQRVTPQPNVPMDAEGAALSAVDQTINKMLTNKSFLDGKFGKELRADPVTWDAYQGLLHLTFMYIIGSALNQTNLYDGSSGKNAVPYLVKMSMGDIKDKATTWHLYWNNTPEAELKWIISCFTGSSFAKVEWWLAQYNTLRDRRIGTLPAEQKHLERKPLFGNAATFIRGVLNGGTTTELISRGLSVDAPPAAVREASGKQRAVPLEFRRIPDKPNADGLEAIFLRIANQVRNLNTKHMDKTARAEMIDKATG